MMRGTPHFVAERLREAREARGLTGVSLSDLLGISRQAVSKYECGHSTPSPETMAKISEVLNLPVSFFWRTKDEAEQPKVFFRSQSAATKTSRTQWERRHEWLREIVAYLCEYVELPKPNLPAFDGPSNPTLIQNADIDALVVDVRCHWGLGNGPISNVVQLLEANGVLVTRGEFETRSLDAFSTMSDGRPYVLLGNDKQSAVRSRFDAAHELGHLLMHTNVDRKYFRSCAEYRLMENQADYFAGALLLPDETFSADFLVPTINALLSLKPKWKTSVAAMIMRARQLRLIHPDEETRLWKSYARQGYKRHEPLDDRLPLEEPTVLRMAFDVLIAEGLSRAQIKEALPFSTKDIEELAGLSVGYLDEGERGKVVPLADYRRQQTEDTPQGKGEVIRFPRGEV